jgi:Domain of unknown function (DUF1905)
MILVKAYLSKTVQVPVTTCHTQSVTEAYAFRAPLWLYPGESAWHFITLPVDIAEEIREESAGRRKGFGSVKVTAGIAGHEWQTSVFPDAGTGSYLLPVKRAVRALAGITAGDDVEVRLVVTL